MPPTASGTPYLFFTGKGGVGKTSLACATAIRLADAGRRVLLVSTDPASNLDEMLGVELSRQPRDVPGVPGLMALNIDPEAAADAYRERVLAPFLGHAPETEVKKIREELSGACTTEIAAFDEFAGLLEATWRQQFDHVVFDTAPTGHTLRLLSLPRAWTDFLDSNTRGASCLGPHSGLTMRRERFSTALAALADPQLTTVVLVTRPERAALQEAERTAAELRALGLVHQRLVINGVFRPTASSDPIALAIREREQAALARMPPALRSLPAEQVPLRAFNMLGIEHLRALLDDSLQPPPERGITAPPPHPTASLSGLIDELAAPGHGFILVMGKGGVGKTTLACAIAAELATRGHPVHLSTTDPAAHVASTLEGSLPNLQVSRIDPRAETQAYIEKTLRRREAELDDEGRALLLEDLASPCTEEVAVFHAFSHLVSEARTSFVVLDTAPTGHTLLLLDATGAYHRQLTRNLPPEHLKLLTPLMRMRDPAYTRVLLVALPETTPVSEAAHLQEDLRRAGIEPWAWIINNSLLATGSQDALLRERMRAEAEQVARVVRDHARRVALVPWMAREPVGLERLHALTAHQARGESQPQPGG
ncbi:arsenical pump-driving ATPase [Corallococcus coralloides]|uniref:arsenical pump-driving ATPase n=1 Tax=Corallococcus coralloides TaxID=184914 RepID=UPI00384BDBC9